MPACLQHGFHAGRDASIDGRVAALLRLALGVTLAACVAAGAAPASTWVEIGDAGDLPDDAQIPGGTGPFTAISGSLLAGGDADLYLIHVDDPVGFEATTCPDSDVDTQLWLFALDGLGITFDDDAPSCGVLSTITGAHVPAPGRYYLGCSAYDWDALDAAGDAIWLDEPYDTERPPDGPGAASPLAQWGDTAYEEGSYVITLAGVSWAVTSVDPVAVPAPVDCLLDQNAPNPFNPHTVIRYELFRAAPIRLLVYDISGRLLRVLIDRRLAAPGAHSTAWDGRDDAGHDAPSGAYLCRLVAGDRTATIRMTLVR
ncbi:MAG: FlgD immunoglobulin-like domain containing protein [Candidatus Eiseniibacteriota bacterium]|jgi:hypothetical protein